MESGSRIGTSKGHECFSGPAAAVTAAPAGHPVVPGQPGPVNGRRTSFGHPAATQRLPLNDTTRQLCAAAYLNDDFAYKIIGETTGDDQRSVPLSLGFDIEPVIRHAFRARRMLVVREAMLTSVIVTGLVLVPGATLAWLALAAGIRTLRRGWRGDSLRTRAGWALIALSPVLYCCVGWFSPLFLLASPDRPDASATGRYDTTSPAGDLPGRISELYNTSLVVLVVALPLILALATLVVALIGRVRSLHTLTRTLAPGTRAPLPTLPNARIEQRVAWLAAAQRGNVSLHSRDPFIGAGRSELQWSMAVLLQGAAVRDGARHGNERFTRETFDPRAISAVRLQQLIRDSLMRLQDPALPPHQRVPGVRLLDRIVAGGERGHGDPLIDPLHHTPLQGATPEVIAAITEQPQGGIRHYLHVLVAVEGRDVRLRDGSVALPAQAQDVVISAFIHVAVEGGKLYIEFIRSVLPPVADEYRLVDRLRPAMGYLIARSLPSLLSDWLNSVAAPVRLTRHLRQIALHNYRVREAREDAKLFRSYEHGARLCARELAAAGEVQTFLQSLDANKYLKLVERTVLSTVLDYLERSGVDTSEFRMQMTSVQTTTVFNGATTMHGPAAFGTNASAFQAAPQPTGASA
ncbi:hypothetical protein [Dactylosporangium sp. NPDC051541]|uniref:hypothetical protein n=1 Tax=Dactylosporangium sp. NPDC051541 TaxID=3363977 RepID=UPI0037B19C81